MRQDMQQPQVQMFMERERPQELQYERRMLLPELQNKQRPMLRMLRKLLLMHHGDQPHISSGSNSSSNINKTRSAYKLVDAC
jgi:hypothetical protein